MTEKEFMTVCGLHWSANRQGTRSNTIVGLAGLVIGFVALLLLFWMGALLIAVGALLLLATWVRSLLWQRAFHEAKKYNSDIAVRISDDCLHVESAVGKSDLNWNFFTWYRDTPDHVLLYMTKRNFSIIPKKSFPDRESLDSFLDLVRARLKNLR